MNEDSRKFLKDFLKKKFIRNTFDNSRRQSKEKSSRSTKYFIR